MEDSTPDSSHVEQTEFLLRYIVRHKSRFEIVERFMKFVDCNDKAGHEITQMITFESQAIPLADCRAQSYDNAASMPGKYNGAQAMIKEQYPTAMFSLCGWHTLNLCGNGAAECIPEAITYYANNIHLIQLQPKEVKILANGLVVRFMAYLASDGLIELRVKIICSSPNRSQVGFGRPARAESNSKMQERNPWSYVQCQFLQLNHNVSRVVQNTGLYWLLQQGHSS